MSRSVGIDGIRVLAVVLVGILCLLPVSGLALEPTYTSDVNPGDPGSGDGFYEDIYGGGGGSDGGLIGDDSLSGDAGSGLEPRDSNAFVPIVWSPVGGWWIPLLSKIIHS